MKHIEGKNLKINNDRTFSCDIIKKKKMSPAKTVSKNAKPKQPSNRNKYVTEERFQEAITSIRRDMVTHEELHRVVHQVVNDAINSLEERMTKLILSLKK